MSRNYKIVSRVMDLCLYGEMIKVTNLSSIAWLKLDEGFVARGKQINYLHVNVESGMAFDTEGDIIHVISYDLPRLQEEYFLIRSEEGYE